MDVPASKPSGSRVQLTFFSIFHYRSEAARQLSPLVGVERVEAGAQGVPLVEVAHVPFHSRAMDRHAPHAGGLLGLFGIRDALEELQHWRAVARHSHADFASLQLQVHVGHVHAGVVTREVLRQDGENLRFLNIRRNAASLQKELLQQFAAWVREEGGDPGVSMASVAQMATRPDLYARVMEQDADFRHVDVLVFALADRADLRHTRQIAYLRAGARILEWRQDNGAVCLQLPAWMATPQSLPVVGGDWVDQPMLPSTLSSLPSGTSLNDNTLSPLENKRA